MTHSNETHTFTLSGLGLAPFEIIVPGVHAMDKGHVFYCEHCGTQIIHRNFVKSSCGIVSVVGIDCLKKSGDQGLIDGYKRIQREERALRREAEISAVRKAKEQAQRNRNGGKTDGELISELEALLETLSADMREEAVQDPVLKLLGDSLFEQSMSHAFYLLKPFTSGQLRVLKEIVTKKRTQARKNSKAYKAGFEASAAMVDQSQAMLSRHHEKLEEIRDSIRRLKCQA